MKYHGLIFDLDGTLIDSFRDIVDSWNEALKISGFPIIHSDCFIEPMQRGKNAILDMILPQDASKDEAQKLLETYKKCYSKNWNRNTKAFPGINELLAEIQNRGIKCAVLSNKSQLMTEVCCKEFLFAESFSCIIGATDNHLPKPFAEKALEIGRKLDLPSTQIALIGDTGIDVETALNAGFGALVATWGHLCKFSCDIAYDFTMLDNPNMVLNHTANPIQHDH